MHHIAKAHAAFVGLPKACLIHFSSGPVRALVWGNDEPTLLAKQSWSPCRRQ